MTAGIYPQLGNFSKETLSATNRNVQEKTMPINKIQKPTVLEDDKEVKVKEVNEEDEESDDPSPKKVASDDDEALPEELDDALPDDEEKDPNDDDPLNDFMTEEESW